MPPHVNSFGYLAGDYVGLEEVRSLFACSEDIQQEEQGKLLLYYMPGSARRHDWSMLPSDIINLIADKISFCPLLQLFGAASKEWCRAITEKTLADTINPKAPLLLLPYNEDTETATFIEMKSSKMYHLKIPEIQGCYIFGSCNGGWLSLNDKTLHISLYNPFMRAQIKYPHPVPVLDRHLRVEPSSWLSCSVMFSDYNRIAICRLGEERPWIVPELIYTAYQDIIFYQGRLFTVQRDAVLSVFNYSETGNLCLSFEKKIQLPWLHPEWMVGKKYLVELDGQIFLINRFLRTKNVLARPRKTWLFQVYVFNSDCKPWTRVNDLEEQSLFLGPNHSYLEEQSLFLGPNHSFFPLKNSLGASPTVFILLNTYGMCTAANGTMVSIVWSIILSFRNMIFNMIFLSGPNPPCGIYHRFSSTRNYLAPLLWIH